MVLTLEGIKKAQDKNRLWDEIFQTVREWWNGSSEELNRASQELEELERKYQNGWSIVEERVQEKFAQMRKEGEQEDSRILNRIDSLQEERTKSLTPLLQESVREINDKEEEVRFLNSSLTSLPPLSPSRKKEARNRIDQLENEIAAIKRRCEQESERYDEEIRRCKERHEQIQDEYFSGNLEDEIRRNSSEEFRRLYESRKAEILRRNQSPIMEEYLVSLKDQIPPEYVRQFSEALRRCSVNGNIILEGNNRRYVMIGQRTVEKPQWSEEANRLFAREFSCMDGGKNFQVPFVVNRSEQEKIPVLVYGDNRDEELNRRFRTVCTAYCLSRCREPLQILHTADLESSDILPEAYRTANPDIFYQIPRGKEGDCLDQLAKLCEEIKEVLRQANAGSIAEYNSAHETKPLPHCLLALEDLPDTFGEKEVLQMVSLMREGGKYGVKVLACLESGKIRAQKGSASRELRRVLQESGYGYEPDEQNFSRVGSSKEPQERLDIYPVESWNEGGGQFLVHRALSEELPHFALESLTEEDKKTKLPQPVFSRPDRKKAEKKSGFLRKFLENQTLPEEIFFPGQSRGKNIGLSADVGHCVKIVSGSRKQYENAVYYLLMQLMLWNVSENRKGNSKQIIYYFNFAENDMKDDDPCFGLACCEKLQYVSPDMLLPGLRLCLEDLRKSMADHDHAVWLVFSGMEYLSCYQGYEKEEAEEIAVCYGRISRCLSTGNFHVFLAGTSGEACMRLPGTEKNASLTFQLDQKKIIHGTGTEELEMWEPLGGEDIREFEDQIVKY